MKAMQVIGGLVLIGVITAMISSDAFGAYLLLLVFVGFPILLIIGVIRYLRQKNEIKAVVEKLKAEKGPFALELPTVPAFLLDSKTRTAFVVGALKDGSLAVETLSLPFDSISDIEAKWVETTRTGKVTATTYTEKGQLWITTNMVEYPIIRLRTGADEFKTREMSNKISIVMSS